jgi:type I site-specific restriction endonuclease
MVSRSKRKFADYVQYYKPNIPITIIEAKDNNHSVGDGMQQRWSMRPQTVTALPFMTKPE